MSKRKIQAVEGRTRNTKKAAMGSLKEADDVLEKFGEASLKDSPRKSEAVYQDFEIDCGESSGNDSGVSSTEDDSGTSSVRRSGRESKKPTDSYTPSTRSTPRKKRRMKKSILPKKRGAARKKAVIVKLGKPVKLKVDGKPLPGRETEFQEISSKLTTAIRSEQGLCLYLSGVPGTGKTATVKEVIGSLQNDKKIRDFDFVEINGMKLSDPAQVYQVLWRHLGAASQKKGTSAAASQKHLKTYFSDAQRPTVVLLDELDTLLQRKQSILYHFFEWTGLDSAKLIVVAIANTMDLPERLLSNRIASRMGLNRLNFVPYQFKQLEAIIQHRLAPYKHWLHVDALEMCARRVSAVSGDARRAIAVASRAVDFIRAQAKLARQDEPAPNSITLSVMMKILNSAFTGNPVWALETCSGLQLIMLEVVSNVWKNQLSAYDVAFYTIAERFWQQCRNKNIGFSPSMADVKSSIWTLVSAGLLRLEPDNENLAVDTKIIALYTDEDLRIALKNKETVQ